MIVNIRNPSTEGRRAHLNIGSTESISPRRPSQMLEWNHSGPIARPPRPPAPSDRSRFIIFVIRLIRMRQNSIIILTITITIQI